MTRVYAPGQEPIPGYRLDSFLGRGGFGEVWRATSPGGTTCALKLISLKDRQGLKEFRAIKLVKNIKHSHLTPINGLWLKDEHGMFMDDNTRQDSLSLRGQDVELIIAMGLGDKNLWDRLEECRKEGKNGIPVDELLGYMEDAARGLDFLHNPPQDEVKAGRKPIQHCDIKPQNILLVGDSAQVCDFGLARTLGGDERQTSTAAHTPAYVAPELLQENPSRTADQYSLAVSYYELRTGSLPFRGRTTAEILFAHIQGKLTFEKLPEAEQEVLRRGTNLDPEKRFPNCHDMVRSLRRAVEGRSSSTSGSSGVRSGMMRIIELMQAGDEIVPGYRLIRKRGRGGSGVVWEASAPGGKSVALKIIGNLDRGGSRQEFRALEMIKGLDHNHLMEVHAYWLLDAGGDVIPDADRDRPDGPKARTLVIASKLAGKNLLQRLHECQQPPQCSPGIPLAELLEYMHQAAQAIDYLNAPQHMLGDRLVSIQHRDIKPENILLAADTVKVSDFGLAKVLEGTSTLIHRDSVGRTLHYAAPEFFDNKLTDRSDQYGLALTYYHLRTGVIPFAQATEAEIIASHTQGRLNLNRLPEAERAVIARATALAAEDRFATCCEMVQTLEEAIRAESPGEIIAHAPSQRPRRQSGAHIRPDIFQPDPTKTSGVQSPPTHPSPSEIEPRQPAAAPPVDPDDIYNTVPRKPNGVHPTLPPKQTDTDRPKSWSADTDSAHPALPGEQPKPAVEDFPRVAPSPLPDVTPPPKVVPKPKPVPDPEPEPKEENWLPPIPEPRRKRSKMPAVLLAIVFLGLAGGGIWTAVDYPRVKGIIGSILGPSAGSEPSSPQQKGKDLAKSDVKSKSVADKIAKSTGDAGETGARTKSSPVSPTARELLANALGLLDTDPSKSLEIAKGVLEKLNVEGQQANPADVFQALLLHARACARRMDQAGIVADLQALKEGDVPSNASSEETRLVEALRILYAPGPVDSCLEWVEKHFDAEQQTFSVPKWEHDQLKEHFKRFVRENAKKILDGKQEEKDEKEAMKLARLFLALDQENVDAKAHEKELKALEQGRKATSLADPSIIPLAEFLSEGNTRRRAAHLAVYMHTVSKTADVSQKLAALEKIAAALHRPELQGKDELVRAFKELQTKVIDARLPELTSVPKFQETMKSFKDNWIDLASPRLKACHAECLIETGSESPMFVKKALDLVKEQDVKFAGPYGNYVRGRARELSKNRQEAVTDFEQAFRVSESWQTPGRKSRAAAALYNAAKELPAGKNQEAFRLFKQAVALSPQPLVEYRLGLAESGLKLSPPERLIALNQSETLLKDPGEERLGHLAYNVLLVNAQAQEKTPAGTNKALERYLRILQLNEDNKLGTIEPGKLYLEVIVSGLETAKSAGQSPPADTRRLLARLYAQRGHLIYQNLSQKFPLPKEQMEKEAIASYAEAARLHPTEDRQLAEYLMWQGHLARGQKESWKLLNALATRAMKAAPNFAGSLYLQGIALHWKAVDMLDLPGALKLCDQAVEALNEAIRLGQLDYTPSEIRCIQHEARSAANVLRANYVHDLAQPNAAEVSRAYLQTAITDAKHVINNLNPQYVWHAYFQLGNALEDMAWRCKETSFYDQAEAAFTTAMRELRVPSPLLLRSRGRVNYRRTRHAGGSSLHLQKAADDLSEACRLSEVDAEARLFLAQVCLLKGDLTASTESFRKGIAHADPKWLNYAISMIGDEIVLAEGKELAAKDRGLLPAMAKHGEKTWRALSTPDREMVLKFLQSIREQAKTLRRHLNRFDNILASYVIRTWVREGALLEDESRQVQAYEQARKFLDDELQSSSEAAIRVEILLMRSELVRVLKPLLKLDLERPRPQTIEDAQQAVQLCDEHGLAANSKARSHFQLGRMHFEAHKSVSGMEKVTHLKVSVEHFDKAVQSDPGNAELNRRKLFCGVANLYLAITLGREGEGQEHDKVAKRLFTEIKDSKSESAAEAEKFLSDYYPKDR